MKKLADKLKSIPEYRGKPGLKDVSRPTLPESRPAKEQRINAAARYARGSRAARARKTGS